MRPRLLMVYGRIMGRLPVEERLRALADRGVTIVDPRQTWVADDVGLNRVCPGATLYPGTRLQGARTFVGPRARVGVEGPATLVDAVLGPEAQIDAGYLHGAVLLDGARAGWGAHFRPGTLLEEEASTAHTVGLKHTILLGFVTLGSLINLCDVLMAGGSSRRDHSEVGSGFIHFNFTPWGKRGDKATPSLVGDVTRGVFLREPRIFLGGAGGLVGPAHIGYGAITAAGQVVRADVPAERLVLQPPPSIDVEVSPGRLGRAASRREKNIVYIGQLLALRAWYRQVRRRRIPDRAREGDPAWIRRTIIDAAIETLDSCIAERIDRLEGFLRERAAPRSSVRLDPEPPCPLGVGPASSDGDHVPWVQGLADADVEQLRAWLVEVAGGVHVDDVG